MAHGIDTGAHPGRKVDINAHLARHNTPIEARKSADLAAKTREFAPGEFERINALLAGKGQKAELTRSGMVGYGPKT